MSYEICTRPMTAEERGAMKRILSRPARFYGLNPTMPDLTMGALFGFLAGVVAALAALTRGRELWAWVLWLAFVLGGVSVAAALHRRSSRPMRERQALYRWELEEDVVTEFECAVSGAVEVYDSSKEMTAYLLQVEAGRVLFLNGRYLDEAADRGFPTERFRLARAPHSWEVLRLECDGARLHRVAVIEPTQLRRPFEDGQLADGVIADFVTPG